MIYYFIIEDLLNLYLQKNFHRLENDVPIVPNIGMFASFDPVALDMACVDAVNRQPVMAGSILAEQNHCHHDHFTDTHPETNWESCIDHAVKLGLGSKEYHLIEI